MKCIWCGHSEHTFEPGKPYCEGCTLKCQREYVACKKPYPNLKAFALNEKRCNSCQKKYECNKKKKEMKKLEDDIENDEIKVFSNPPNIQIKRPEVRGSFRWCFISRAASVHER